MAVVFTAHCAALVYLARFSPFARHFARRPLRFEQMRFSHAPLCNTLPPGQKERGPEDPLSYRGWLPPDQADRGKPWDGSNGRIGAA
jgi:hypothetical protein